MYSVDEELKFCFGVRVCLQVFRSSRGGVAAVSLRHEWSFTVAERHWAIPGRRNGSGWRTGCTACPRTATGQTPGQRSQRDNLSGIRGSTVSFAAHSPALEESHTLTFWFIYTSLLTTLWAQKMIDRHRSTFKISFDPPWACRRDRCDYSGAICQASPLKNHLYHL